MTFSGIFDYFNFWNRAFRNDGIQSTNRFQGDGTQNYPRNHKSKKKQKAFNKNRAGKKARKQNRRK